MNRVNRLGVSLFKHRPQCFFIYLLLLSCFTKKRQVTLTPPQLIKYDSKIWRRADIFSAAAAAPRVIRWRRWSSVAPGSITRPDLFSLKLLVNTFFDRIARSTDYRVGLCNANLAKTCSSPADQNNKMIVVGYVKVDAALVVLTGCRPLITQAFHGQGNNGVSTI